MKVINLLWVICVCSLALTGCLSLNKEPDVDYDKASGGGRYTILQDHAPTGDIKVDHLPDLIPKWEPKSRGGNKSAYEVWGKTYYVMPSAKGYSAEGTASWYGKKFHGHKTSNGEIYDMYSFSAAHKTLPIPTYLKVTNLDNQRSIIVRVNDRGPFHGDRLIDLSYAAAARLDYHKKGLANVRIEAITPEPDSASYSSGSSIGTEVSAQARFTHLQLGAFSVSTSADRLKQRLLDYYSSSVKVSVNKQADGLYKVMVGPYTNSNTLLAWQEKMEKDGFGSSVRVNLFP